MSEGRMIEGYITRLVPGEGGRPDRIFFRPSPETDLRTIDGHHKAGGEGELVAWGSLTGRALGEVLTVELTGHDPNTTELRAVPWSVAAVVK